MRERIHFTCQHLSPLISLFVPSTVCHIHRVIDRAVLDMDSCPVTCRLGQLTHLQSYILDEAMKSSPELMHKLSKESREANVEKEGRERKNEGHDRSFCSACS